MCVHIYTHLCGVQLTCINTCTFQYRHSWSHTRIHAHLEFMHIKMYKTRVFRYVQIHLYTYVSHAYLHTQTQCCVAVLSHITARQTAPLHHRPSHCMTLYYNGLQYIKWHYGPLHYVARHQHTTNWKPINQTHNKPRAPRNQTSKQIGKPKTRNANKT